MSKLSMKQQIRHESYETQKRTLDVWERHSAKKVVDYLVTEMQQGFDGPVNLESAESSKPYYY